ncbi:MAG TPA: AzlD domain-containing protein [Spirochaetales bacterium]|nr:AzlD domain-containing protein [Spirochaetales bacterium]
MTNLRLTYLLLVVLVMTLATYFTRAMPFLFFSKRKPPAFLNYLQRLMPPVVMVVLVFASYKDIDFRAAPHGVPALIAGALTAGLHFWKRNTLLSIAGGTALYMVLIWLI